MARLGWFVTWPIDSISSDGVDAFAKSLAARLASEKAPGVIPNSFVRVSLGESLPVEDMRSNLRVIAYLPIRAVFIPPRIVEEIGIERVREIVNEVTAMSARFAGSDFTRDNLVSASNDASEPTLSAQAPGGTTPFHCCHCCPNAPTPAIQAQAPPLAATTPDPCLTLTALPAPPNGLMSFRGPGEALAGLAPWHLGSIFPAQAAEPVATTVTVASLDSGYASSSCALAPKVTGAISWLSGNPSVEDASGHGTAAAALISCAPLRHGSNAIHLSVAPHARLLVGRILDDGNEGTGQESTNALLWAVANDAQIINYNAGTSGTPTAAFRQAVAFAGTKAVLICPVGNGGPAAGTVEFPARSRWAVGVGAVQKNGTPAYSSSRGSGGDSSDRSVEFVLPGRSIASLGRTTTSPELVVVDGTSYAAPLMAGICAVKLGRGDFAETTTAAFRAHMTRELPSSAHSHETGWGKPTLP